MKSRDVVPLKTENLRKNGLVSKPYTMISEFIDNSISSYIGNSKTKNDLSELCIEVTFDYRDKNNFKIYIVDNAYGMNEYALENSLEVADLKRKHKTSNLNKYGVGMKVATFWSGERIDIYSNDSCEENYVYLDLQELDAINNGLVKYRVEPKSSDISYLNVNNKNFFKNRGTKIIISKGHETRYDLLEKNNFNHFISVLGFKFNRFLDKKLNLDIGIFNPNGTVKYQKVIPHFPEAENITQWIIDMLNTSKKINSIEQKKEIAHVFISNLITHLRLSMKNEELKNDIIYKIKHKQKFIWTKKIIFKKEPLVSFEYKIGILKNTKGSDSDLLKKYVDFTGFTVYEADRAIMCGPNNFKDSQGSKNYIADLKTAYGGPVPEYRIFGEFDVDYLLELGAISISDQKFGFEWKTKSYEEIFLNSVNQFKEDISSLLIALQGAQNKYLEPENWSFTKKGKESVKMLQTTSVNFFPVDYDEEEEKNLNVYKYNYINPKTRKKGIIKIEHIESNDVSKNFYKSEKITDEIYEVTINVLHPIWKPLVNTSTISKTSFITSVHRLVFLYSCLNDINSDFGDYINEIANSAFKE